MASIEQVAAFLGVTQRTVYNRIRNGYLNTVYTTRGRKVLKDDLYTNCPKRQPMGKKPGRTYASP